MVDTSCSPFTLSVEPVETRSTITSATPRCGAISAAPVIGTMVTRRPSLVEETFGQPREYRRYARAICDLSHIVDAAVLARGHGQPAAPEFEVEQRELRRGPTPRSGPGP